MIQELIKIHDRFRFEMKLGYMADWTKKDTAYNIETYFFIPHSLDINRETYSKRDFYDDLQTYIRFKTPVYGLQNILSGPDNPYEKLRTSFQNLVLQPSKQNILQYKNTIRMFCCIFKSSLRDHVFSFSARSNLKEMNDRLSRYPGCVKEIASRYRELNKQLNISAMDEKLFSIYLFGDEYISLLIEKYSYDILEKIREAEFPEKDKNKKDLLEVIQSEIHYRKKNNFRSIPDENSTNEQLVFRKGVLKKYMESVLFLKTRTEREGRFLEQVLFGVAAGFSMLFATGIAYYSQYKYGTFTMPVFFALVVSYMFKDRIKELMRYYFNKKIHGSLFDHKTDIYCGPEEKIGWCKESFDFVKHTSIPDSIRKARNIDRITEIEDSWFREKVGLYRESIRIFPDKIKKIYGDFTLEGINDIMRFNISKFLLKMDNPKKRMYIPDEDGYHKIYATRVYHMNLIIKYSTRSKEFYNRFRIVFNRDGLQRIEEINLNKTGL
ncbi:MAG: hypothetical protein PHF84_12415 [bacterium]|nr:hypothetical protein [bacterium]